MTADQMADQMVASMADLWVVQLAVMKAALLADRMADQMVASMAD